jgi:hypothetical protein
MEITKQEAENLRPPRGRVIIEVPNIISEDVKVGEAIISVRAISDEARVDMGSRSGTVHSVSPYADIPALCYTWDGPVEIEKGDFVYFSHDAIAKAATVQRDEAYYYTFNDEGHTRCLLVVPYKEIILCIRESDGKFSTDHIYALNDYVVIKKVLKPKPSFLYMPDEYEKDIFEVVYPPTGDIVYDWREGYLKCNWKNTKVEVGMIVKSKSKSPVKLEFKYKQLMTEDLYYIQSHAIIAQVNG